MAGRTTEIPVSRLWRGQGWASRLSDPLRWIISSGRSTVGGSRPRHSECQRQSGATPGSVRPSPPLAALGHRRHDLYTVPCPPPVGGTGRRGPRWRDKGTRGGGCRSCTTSRSRGDGSSPCVWYRSPSCSRTHTHTHTHTHIGYSGLRALRKRGIKKPRRAIYAKI